MTKRTDLGIHQLEFERANSSVLQSAVERFWLVMWAAIVTAAAFVLLSMITAQTYSASTSLVVADPLSSQVFASPGAADPGRYVADQVAIIESFVVAERAAEILADTDLTLPIPTLADFRPDAKRLSINSDPNSNVIHIGFEGRSPMEAFAGSQAIATAYTEVRREEATRSVGSARDQLDTLISGLDAQLEAIAQELRPGLDNEIVAQLEGQELDILARVLDLRNELLVATSPAQITLITSQINALTQQLSTAASQPTNIQELLSQQGELITRRNVLAGRRDEIAVNAELAAGGVTFVSRSTDARPTGLGTTQLAALGLALGMILGISLAHYLALRDRRVSSHEELATVLDMPLLAAIPDFRSEQLKGDMPARDHPRSAAAEAFRFASSSLEIRTDTTRAQMVLVVSGTLGEGKSTVTSNLGLAAAAASSEDKRILLVDCDFGSQMLTERLVKHPPLHGITDVVNGVVTLESALANIPTGGNGSLSLLSRGGQIVSAPAFFGGSGAKQFFERLRQEFDLIILDSPPLLQIAYANTLARIADASILVVSHGSDRREVEAVADALTLLNQPCLGYVYNRTPLHKRMTQTGGSMSDVIGDAGFKVTPTRGNP